MINICSAYQFLAANSVFTLKDAMAYVQTRDPKLGRNRLAAGLRNSGYNTYRGSRKIAGKAYHTPHFFTKTDLSAKTKREQYDFYQKRQ